MSTKKDTKKQPLLTPQAENFPQWYQDVVKEAELAENSQVRGCGIVRPYGMKIWDLIKADLARRIEATGAENVYFPIFLPMENLQSEKDHVEGFSPELAVVTHGGGEKLTNELAVRPTSEAAMYPAYSRWIQSYKDLPLRLNQWNNVVRWEKRPRPFLRWSEFLWQEGHTVFATREEALKEMWQMLDIYQETYHNLGIPVFKGKKSTMETFAGADITTTVEIMARDGKAIQGATSHHLGTKFSKAFNVKYRGQDEQEHYGHQNSWGFAWRSVGALIMTHGDDRGLRLPPAAAPFEIVIVPIFQEKNQSDILGFTDKIRKDLSRNYRVKVDDREGLSPGFKFNHWELKGTPVRLEVGQKEMETEALTLFRRDLGEKEILPLHKMKGRLKEIIREIPQNLYQQAKEFSQSHIHRIESVEEIRDQKGFFEASWCESEESERMLKEKFQMVSRVLPKENEGNKPKNSKCFLTGKPARQDWLFAKSY